MKSFQEGTLPKALIALGTPGNRPKIPGNIPPSGRNSSQAFFPGAGSAGFSDFPDLMMAMISPEGLIFRFSLLKNLGKMGRTWG